MNAATPLLFALYRACTTGAAVAKSALSGFEENFAFQSNFFRISVRESSNFGVQSYTHLDIDRLDICVFLPKILVAKKF